ncbi:right-handed parallel beta-helix repeat-containing protein [Nonomuraea ferruginea]
MLAPGEGGPVGVPRLHDAGDDVVSGVTVHGEGVADVRVEKLSVRGFSGAGIYAHTVSGVTVHEVTAEDNAVWGVYLRESSGCAVTGCRASGSQYGGVALSFCPPLRRAARRQRDLRQRLRHLRRQLLRRAGGAQLLPRQRDRRAAAQPGLRGRAGGRRARLPGRRQRPVRQRPGRSAWSRTASARRGRRSPASAWR